jgi:hypothetical protein
MMRKLPYLLLAMLLLGGLEAVRACSWFPPPSDEDLFAKASAVFVARIVRAEQVEMQYPVARWGPNVKGPAVEATFRLIEILKGQPPADGKVRGPPPFMCVRPLVVGLDYVIFLNEGDNFIVWAADKGTRPLMEDRLCEYKHCILEKMRNLSRKAQ